MRPSSAAMARSSISSRWKSTTGLSSQSGSIRPSQKTASLSSSQPPSNFSFTSAQTSNGCHVICAVSESRGLSPTVGMAVLNLEWGEALFCQLCDSQTYVKTINKLNLYLPSEVLVINHGVDETGSSTTLLQIVENHLPDIRSSLTPIDRKYWSESKGIKYIQQLACKEDVEEITMLAANSYYAICSLAAVFSYAEFCHNVSISPHSIRFKCTSSDGAMMIDMSTIRALELIQNLRQAKSKDCLLGHLNETLTSMGARMLRSSILQPLIDLDIINDRLDALEELSINERMFRASRNALKGFVDCERILTWFITIHKSDKRAQKQREQSINQVLALKQFLLGVEEVGLALGECQSTLLCQIRELCHVRNTVPISTLIHAVINGDTTFATKPLELRIQRAHAVKPTADDILEISRQVFAELQNDVCEYVTELANSHRIHISPKFDNSRQYFLIIPHLELEDRELPPEFINRVHRKHHVECQTIKLLQFNFQLKQAHDEILVRSDVIIQNLIEEIRGHISVLFKSCESVALLDMLAAFAHVATSRDYVRPVFNSTLAVRAGRHPIREKIQSGSFVPNDVYASEHSRFQIITGCNMSGKSTYIRSIALTTVMAQIGCFVPAHYGSFPLRKQLFARVTMDDCVEANMSTFGTEMNELAFILRNVDRNSMVIIDELGRGTSVKDGLAIAIAAAESLVDSQALVWFATHFRELATVLSRRNGVVSLHLAVDMSSPTTMKMLYRVADGCVQEKHYGIQFARILGLPTNMVALAVEISTRLEREMGQSEKNSVDMQLPGAVAATAVQAHRRRHILTLFEHLSHALTGSDGHGDESENTDVNPELLKEWLSVLQRQFVNRMMETAVDVRSS